MKKLSETENSNLLRIHARLNALQEIVNGIHRTFEIPWTPQLIDALSDATYKYLPDDGDKITIDQLIFMELDLIEAHLHHIDESKK